ncbi:MAG: hypothetical protein KH168_10785 [Clostridiaceae bacterium]|nr:hypothetical protein [Clostridiaceae bacterium]
MRKVKLFLTPHIEIRIHVSEEMTGACELKGLKEQLGGISGETDGKER